MFDALLPSATLCYRELVRFLRQRNRVIGALATPIVFWLLIGGGMGHSFTGPTTDNAAAETGGYLAYFFPGTLLMIVLFTAIFSTISVIEDRREGFLQGVLVAPVGRTAIVNGKVFGGALLAAGQAVIVLLLGWISGVVHFNFVELMNSILLLFVISIALTGLGLSIAWSMTSTQGFHAIMNLFLMPMWLLSGALFPLRDDTPQVLRIIMLANPLTYCLTTLRRAMGSSISPAGGAWWVDITVTIVFTIAMLALTFAVARRRTKADVV